MMGAILDHLWQSTLVAFAAGLLAMAFRKAGASVRYGLWFAASVKFLIPFAALAALGERLAPAVRPPPIEAAPDAVFIAQATEPFSQTYGAAPATLAAAPVAHAAAGFDPSLVLLAAWALGCAAVLIAWMVRWARVRRIARAATPLPWPAPMPVRASASMLEPGLVGLWRPVLIVPESLPDHLAQPQIDALVAHEACHLRRRDNLTAAVHMLVEALFWFHPLVWWIGARLIEARERACDEAVVGSGHDRAAYARGLVECCRLYLQSPLSCVAGASGSNLKARVELIMTAPPSSPLTRWSKALLLAAGVCAIASPVAAGWLTSPAGHEAATRVAAVASKALAVGVGVAGPARLPPDATPSPEGSPKVITMANNEASATLDPAVAAPVPSSLPPQMAPAGEEGAEPSPEPNVTLSPQASVDVSKTLTSLADGIVSEAALIPVSAPTPEASALLAAAGNGPTLPTSELVWVRLPPQTWSWPNDVYPIAAEARHLPGRAAIRCRADERGWLTRCVVTDESPAGLGFGRAAILLSRQYKLRTLAADGTPVHGHLVDVTVRFTPRYYARIVEDAGRYDYSKPPQLVRWLVYPAGYESSPAPPPVYPDEAGRLGAAAEVVLHCRVKADGFLTDCTAAKENPKGLGFGRAALLAHIGLLRVAQHALDGTPMAGRTIEVRYVMNPPCWYPADSNQRPCSSSRH